MNDRLIGKRPRWSLFPVHVLLGWLGLIVGIAQAQQAPLRLTAARLSGESDVIVLHEYDWRFHPGDDPDWPSRSFDDRSWPAVKTMFGKDKPLPGWRGMGWFRLRIAVDSSLIGQTLALQVNHDGASEIYVDGQRKARYGTVGHSKEQMVGYSPYDQLVVLRFADTKPHLLAVRYTNFNRYFPNFLGIETWIGPHGQLLANLLNRARFSGYTLISVGIQGALMLLHLFLFLFYPRQRLNLYYSLFIAFSGGTVFAQYLHANTTDPALQALIQAGFNLCKTMSVVMGGLLLYSIGYRVLPRWRFGLVCLGATYFLIAYTSFPELQIRNAFTLFFLLVIGDGLWALSRAMRRRQPGVWLIGLGMFLEALVFFFIGADVLNVWPNDPLLINLLMSIGLLPLPLCFSLYLALDFARTNRDLTTRLQQVEALSVQTLAQETEKRKLITEQAQRLEQTVQERTAQVQQQADKLREMDATKSRFFTNLTHEFRTPLTLMLGPAERVLAETQEPNTKQQVGLLQRNARRLLQLINQLLDLSKLEAGKMVLNPSPGDLVSLVKGALLSFESLAQQKQITLHVQANMDQLPMAIDRDKLEQILYNLVGNALKFTPTGGLVSVVLTRREDEPTAWAELVVTDTGIGIPAAKLPYIFDRFYQVDASDTREREGTGIGLALTNELVDLHGGSIQVRSEENVGTAVTVRLPIHPVPLPAETPEPTLKPLDLPFATVLPPATDQRTNPADAPLVLLIEDNDDVRTFIRSSLQDQYRICEAANGKEGVRLAQEQVPDLVVTDLMMPKMDGYQVCATLKQDERTSHIPIVMLTAKADLDSRIEGLETGADCYLAKPFHQRELLAQIGALIQNRRQLQARYRQLGVFGQRSPRLSSMEEVFLNRVRSVISEHIADEQFSVEMLSREVGISRMQLHRKLIALLDLSPGDLIRQIRLELAHDLLRDHVATVAEVAYQVGFGNPANFSTSFSRHFGYAPSDVRKQSAPLSTRKSAKNG